MAAVGCCGYTTELNVEHCVASGNANGFLADGRSGGTVIARVSDSMATDNEYGFYIYGGTRFYKAGSNTIGAATLPRSAAPDSCLTGHITDPPQATVIRMNETGANAQGGHASGLLFLGQCLQCAYPGIAESCTYQLCGGPLRPRPAYY